MFDGFDLLLGIGIQTGKLLRPRFAKDLRGLQLLFGPTAWQGITMIADEPRFKNKFAGAVRYAKSAYRSPPRNGSGARKIRLSHRSAG